MKQILSILVVLITLSLSAQSQMPEPRYGHSVCKIDSVYYIFGGVTDGNKLQSAMQIKALIKNDIYAYFPNSCTFSKLTPSGVTVPGMAGHNAIVYNKEMYVFNGLRSEANDATYVFNPINNLWSETSEPPYESREYVFNGTRSEATNASLYVISGGRKLSDGTASNECWTYDAQADVWSQKAPMAYGGRYAGAGAVIGSKFYVYGGLSDNGPAADIFVYNFNTNMWSWIMNPTGAFPGGIYGMMITQLGNNFYIAGGGMWSGKKDTQDDVSFSTSLYQFQVDTVSDNIHITECTNILPPIMFGAGWISVENNDTLIYMFGGINSITTTGDTTLTNNFYRYNLTQVAIQQYDTVSQSWGPLITSINETEFKVSEELSIFPNPGQGQIAYKLQTNEKVKTIKMYNQYGQLVQEKKSPVSEMINISQLSTGIYFIRIDTETNRYLGKVIKN